MQREGWRRHWGKGIEKEGASDGERERLLLGNSIHTGDHRKQVMQTAPYSAESPPMGSDREETREISSRNQ